jgi:hypothetical protein
VKTGEIPNTAVLQTSSFRKGDTQPDKSLILEKTFHLLPLLKIYSVDCIAVMNSISVI